MTVIVVRPLVRCFVLLPTPARLLRKTYGTLRVEPSGLALVHEPVRVSGSQLPAESRVTLRTQLLCEKRRLNFVSVNHYKTDGQGKFDTKHSGTLEGSSYSGVHSSGPVFSLQPEAGSVQRLWLQNISSRLPYTFQLYSGTHLIDEVRMERTFLSSHVTRIGIRQGNIRGALFMPSNVPPGGPPPIITIYGGLVRDRAPEDRAALLASEGYAALALAFFGTEGLPAVYKDISLEYFEEAVDFMLSLPEVSSAKVGLFGLSKGGDIVGAMASFLGSKIGPTVAVNFIFGSCPGSTLYKGKVVIEESQFEMNFESGRVLELKGGPDLFAREPARQVPIEQASAPILCIVGSEDTLNTDFFAEIARGRAVRSGKENFKVLSYSGLGHLLDSPNSPVCVRAKNPLTGDRLVEYGGKVEEHALAQIRAWSDMLEFYTNNF